MRDELQPLLATFKIMGLNVISGYASLNINGRWVGVIAGNIYCNKSRNTADKALDDAKELYNNFYCC